MSRLLFLALVFSSCFTRAVFSQDKDQEQAHALQKVMQKAIGRAGPSIACILVSRSEVYRQLIGQPPDFDTSGKLGDFKLGVFSSEEERQQFRRKYDLADSGHIPEAFGSGVVIDPQGLVLTNYHVIRDATKVYIRLPGGKAGYADIHAADPRSDLAVLRVRDARLLPLQAIPLGDASKIQSGQFALTLTNPFVAVFVDDQPTASWGIISNIRRRIPNQAREEERPRPLYSYGTLLQTDSRVPLSCSGGALLNLQGELIGLTTTLAAIHGGETPGGFALPIDAGTRRILDVLRRGEEVDYGFLGVAFKEPLAGFGKGVEVTDITPGSPAEKEAYLRVRDVIAAVNDVSIKESDDLFLNLGTQLAGNKVTLKILRPGIREPINVDVTLGKFNVTGKKIASSLGKRPFFRGLRVDYTTLLVQQTPRFPRVPAGVLVTEVQTGTAAAQAKLKPGEVITHVNNRPVTNPMSFYQAVAELQGPIECRLFTFGSQEPPAKVVLK